MKHLELEQRLELDGVSDPILFYRGDDEDYGWMSSFSYLPIVMPHPWMKYDDLYTYDTREHYYQACKATSSEAHEWVRTAPTPSSAKKRGGPGGIELRLDWGNDQGDICWHVMVESIFALVYQNFEIAQALRETGKRHIYEDSPIDDIWGWQKHGNYNGKNLLGKGWMHVRSVISPLKEYERLHEALPLL